jgi:hypothetical protein
MVGAALAPVLFGSHVGKGGQRVDDDEGEETVFRPGKVVAEAIADCRS